MITMWHSEYIGDTPPGIYLSKNIHLLKSYLPKTHFVIFTFAQQLPVFDEHALITITCTSYGKEDNAML